jgi:hypothetical protein
MRIILLVCSLQVQLLLCELNQQHSLGVATPAQLPALRCTAADDAALSWSQAAATEGYEGHAAEQPAMAAAAAMRPMQLWCLLLLLTGARHVRSQLLPQTAAWQHISVAGLQQHLTSPAAVA